MKPKASRQPKKKKRAKSVKIKLDKKMWRIAIEPPGKNNWAFVDFTKRRIKLSPHLKSKGRLAKIIHEVLHIAFKFLDESAIVKAEAIVMEGVHGYWKLEKLLNHTAKSE